MTDKIERQQSWAECQSELGQLARKQLFFVGGVPRSGTTWLQQLLDYHPQVSCSGEGLFGQNFAVPLENLMAERRKVLETKNLELFNHTGGYPLPDSDDIEMLIGTAILLGFRQQRGGKLCDALGEKTPDNMFFFPRLKRLFPNAKFIGIVRDPRDVFTSIWHFFYAPKAQGDLSASKTAFLQAALTPFANCIRQILALEQAYPGDCMVVTYETLQRTPNQVLAQLFRFLGVSDEADVVADCLARASFLKQTGGRPAGTTQNGSFHRKGVVGDWPSTLTPEMNTMILQELEWMFPHFGWQP